MKIPLTNVMSESQSLRLTKAVTTFVKILEDVRSKEDLEMSIIISVAYVDVDKKKFAEIAGVNDQSDELLAAHFVQSEVLGDINNRVRKVVTEIKGGMKDV